MSFSPDLSWDDAVVVTISDASFCQEQDQLDGNTRNVKSQQACITALAPGNTVHAEKFELGFDENQKSLSQYIDGRSLRTVQCCRTWIANTSYHRRHERTAQYSSVGGNGFCSNGTRLVRSSLKQLIWDNRGDCDEEVDGSNGDYPRWVDTSAMLSDCLMKTMTSCWLNETFNTGIFVFRPTEESLGIKAKTRSGEHRRKEKNGCKILTIDISRVCNARRDCKIEHDFIEPDFVPVKFLSLSET